jgi:hypothetical protein
VIYPTWLQAVLFVGAALDTYFMTQTTMIFAPVVVLALGAGNVAIAALLAFQKQAVNVTRTIRGLPRNP